MHNFVHLLIPSYKPPRFQCWNVILKMKCNGTVSPSSLPGLNNTLSCQFTVDCKMCRLLEPEVKPWNDFKKVLLKKDKRIIVDVKLLRYTFSSAGLFRVEKFALSKFSVSSQVVWFVCVTSGAKKKAENGEATTYDSCYNVSDDGNKRVSWMFRNVRSNYKWIKRFLKMMRHSLTH